MKHTLGNIIKYLIKEALLLEKGPLPTTPPSKEDLYIPEDLQNASESDIERVVPVGLKAGEKLVFRRKNARLIAFFAYKNALEKNIVRDTWNNYIDYELAQATNVSKAEIARIKKRIKSDPNYIKAISESTPPAELARLKAAWERTNMDYITVADIDLPDSVRRFALEQRKKARIEKEAKEAVEIAKDEVSLGDVKNTSKILDISEIEPLKWYQWPDEVKSSNEPYSGEAGVGPGEHWLALVFGGKVQGGSVSYDVVTIDSRKWEVKELIDQSTTIRPGTHGTRVLGPANVQIKRIIQTFDDISQLTSDLLVDHNSSDYILLADEDNKNKKQDVILELEYIAEFIRDEKQNFAVAGEITEERFEKLYNRMMGLYRIYNGNNVLTTTIDQSKLKSLVDKANSLNDISLSDDEIERIESELASQNIIAQIMVLLRRTRWLKDNPKNTLQNIFDQVKPSLIFAKTDGLFVVNQKHFIMIPKDQLDVVLEFTKVTQNLPRLRFNVKFPSGGKIKPGDNNVDFDGDNEEAA